jgi:hypothetical protein
MNIRSTDAWMPHGLFSSDLSFSQGLGWGSEGYGHLINYNKPEPLIPNEKSRFERTEDRMEWAGV